MRVSQSSLSSVVYRNVVFSEIIGEDPGKGVKTENSKLYSVLGAWVTVLSYVYLVKKGKFSTKNCVVLVGRVIGLQKSGWWIGVKTGKGEGVRSQMDPLRILLVDVWGVGKWTSEGSNLAAHHRLERWFFWEQKNYVVWLFYYLLKFHRLGYWNAIWYNIRSVVENVFL